MFVTHSFPTGLTKDQYFSGYGYEMIDLEPVVMDTIDVSDNEINQDDVDDKNIASPKRHKQLKKEFQKQIK